MAFSRTPKVKFLPDLFSAEKYSSPFNIVLFDGPRSADPPNIWMLSFAILFKTSPEMARVAMSFVKES